MRKIVAILAVPVALGAAAGIAVVAFRRNPRIGSAFMNTVVNPRLVQDGLAGGSASELGTLEHIGRVSGIRRLTPVHPEPTADGYRILVPLGPNSQWARNVVAAGHCRLQVHETVYELDEPTIIPAGEADSLPAAVRGVMAWLGFEYLRLRTFASAPGSLVGAVTAAGEPADVAASEPAEPVEGAPTAPIVDEAVSTPG